MTTPGSTERLWDASPWDGDVTKAQGYKEEYQYDAVGFVKELKRTSYPSSGAQVHTRTYSGYVVAGVQQNNRLASASYPDPSPMPGGPISVSYSYDDGGNCISECYKFLNGEEGQKRYLFTNKEISCCQRTLPFFS